METFDILKLAANTLNNRKAKEINAVKVRDLTTIADYFLMATGTSSTQVHSLADEVETKLAEAGVKPLHVEGKATDWLLLDYGELIIHIFGTKSREFYALDKMWNDGEQVDLKEILELDTEE